MQHGGGRPAVPAFVPRAAGSSAIRIVRPDAADAALGPADAPATQERPRSQSYPRARSTTAVSTTSDGAEAPVQAQLCRDLLINGSCSKPDCPFTHPGAPNGLSAAASPLLAASVSAPVFVPRSSDNSRPSTATEFSLPPSITSASSAESSEGYEYGFAHAVPGDSDSSVEYMTSEMQSFDIYDPSSSDPALAHWGSEYDYSYFPEPQPYIHQPLEYHLYTMPMPQAFIQTRFISDDVREELQKRSEAARSAPPALAMGLPEDLPGYHSLVALEPTTPERRRFGNWFTTVYKAVGEKDGVTYALRRVENYLLTQQASLKPIDQWSRIRHPNIVGVQEGFTTRVFGDNSLVVVYAYHPNAQTLADAYLKQAPGSTTSTPTTASPGGRHMPFGTRGRHGTAGAGAGASAYAHRMPERTLWSFLTQVGGAVKAVHDAGMAVRVLADAAKVLVTGRNRFRIAGCGLVDVLVHDVHPAPDVAQLQQEDLHALGRLVVALCCANPLAINNLPKAQEIMARHYSADVLKIVDYLLVKPVPQKSIAGLLDRLGNRLLVEMDEMQNSVDRLEAELMSELENGRLVRLLAKFGFINERPEFARDARWSETGDRYVIKLFRDFVFHQVDEQGNPLTSLTHVLSCLNKLDAGSEERIMLVARDEQSCIVASYKEIKDIAESAFNELANAGSHGT